MSNAAQFLEIVMLITFGISWPINIAKSLRSRTAKGKSLLFECIIIAGYVAGLAAKIVTYRETGRLSYATWFYILNITMVSIDLVLSIRNARRDRERESATS